MNYEDTTPSLAKPDHKVAESQPHTGAGEPTRQTFLSGRPVLTLKRSGPSQARSISESVQKPLEQRRQQALKVLKQSPAWRERRPLAIGFHRAALKRTPVGLRKTVRSAIYYRSAHRSYLRKIAAGGPRYDWDGQPVGVITQDEQEQARRKLER